MGNKENMKLTCRYSCNQLLAACPDPVSQCALKKAGLILLACVMALTALMADPMAVAAWQQTQGTAAEKEGLTSDPEELYILGKHAYDSGDYEKALEYLLPAAEAGYAGAQNMLGLMYYLGNGTEQSYEEAFRLYRLAADQGYAAGQFNLGLMYYYGHYVEQSYEEASRLYQLAADQGDARAQFDLGYMYAYGQGVEQSYEEAFRLFQMAADQGDADAIYMLGYMYSHGHGVEQSYEKAREYYLITASGDSADAKYARYAIGREYYLGLGAEKDYAEAVKWFRSSAELEYDFAQRMLGQCYFYGYGVEQSYEEAFKWYQLAADQENSHAQMRLGVMYENGYFVEQNYDEALKWYRLSAGQDDTKGQEHLEDLLITVNETLVVIKDTLLRESPAADGIVMKAVLTGVRLTDMGKARESDGKIWIQVKTHDGYTGWVDKNAVNFLPGMSEDGL